MDLDTAMRALEAAGTEQTRKTWRRHGARGKMHGVLYGDLEKLRKQIKCDHTLARALWATRNVDARTLATMIADPQMMRSQDLDAWLRDVDYHGHVDAFVKYVAARSTHAAEKIQTWIASDEECIARAGWQLLATVAMNGYDADLDPYLAIIEAGIHTAPNRAREAMNTALIAIGTRSDALEEKALEAAHRIGKVEVDHGDTSCKTPDAVSCIRKARAHARQKQPV